MPTRKLANWCKITNTRQSTMGRPNHQPPLIPITSPRQSLLISNHLFSIHPFIPTSCKDSPSLPPDYILTRARAQSQVPPEYTDISIPITSIGPCGIIITVIINIPPLVLFPFPQQFFLFCSTQYSTIPQHSQWTPQRAI